MITKEQIIEMAKHVTHRSNGRMDRRIMHPAREWYIGLFFTSVLFVSGSAYAGYIFFTEKNKDIESQNVDVSVLQYEYVRLNNVLDIYSEKRSKFNELRAITPGKVEDIVEEEEESDDPENVEDDSDIEENTSDDIEDLVDDLLEEDAVVDEDEGGTEVDEGDEEVVENTGPEAIF